MKDTMQSLADSFIESTRSQARKMKREDLASSNQFRTFVGVVLFFCVFNIFSDRKYVTPYKYSETISQEQIAKELPKVLVESPVIAQPESFYQNVEEEKPTSISGPVPYAEKAQKLFNTLVLVNARVFTGFAKAIRVTIQLAPVSIYYGA